MTFLKILFVLLTSLPLLFAQSKRPLELADMFKIQRVSDPAISPDGKWVAYTLATPNLAANKMSTDIWIVPAGEAAPGNSPIILRRTGIRHGHLTGNGLRLNQHGRVRRKSG